MASARSSRRWPKDKLKPQKFVYLSDRAKCHHEQQVAPGNHVAEDEVEERGDQATHRDDPGGARQNGLE